MPSILPQAFRMRWYAYVKKSIWGEILSSIPQYWSILANDISTFEQVSLCVWFVSRTLDVCEEFVGFINIAEWIPPPLLVQLCQLSKNGALTCHVLLVRGVSVHEITVGHQTFSEHLRHLSERFSALLSERRRMRARMHVVKKGVVPRKTGRACARIVHTS